MAEDLRIALQELLRKAELDSDVDFLREGVRVMAQQLMELEVAQHVSGESAVSGIGYRGRAVSDAQAGGAVPVLLARCDVPQSQAGAPRGQHGGGHCRGRQLRRPT